MSILGKTETELRVSLTELRRNQFKWRLMSGEETVPTHEVRKTRRNIARIMTRLSQLKEGNRHE